MNSFICQNNIYKHSRHASPFLTIKFKFKNNSLSSFVEKCRSFKSSDGTGSRNSKAKKSKKMIDTQTTVEKSKVTFDENLEEIDEEEIRPFYEISSPAFGSEGPLPDVTKEQVLKSCGTVCAIFLIMSLTIRQFAETSPSALGNDPEKVKALLSLTKFNLIDGIIAVTASGIVTGARIILYNNWKDFAIATNRTNKQVLDPLGLSDYIYISFLPGISEEFLFRSGLVTALYNDWRGVIISGTIFGILHNGSGRNWAFVIWASLIGSLYGALFLWTEDIYVPILAHSFSNLFSILYWKNQYSDTN